MKKMLMLATVPSMIGQFNMSNIDILLDLEYKVHVACDFKDRSVWTEDRVNQFVNDLREKDISYFQIGFPRNPMHINKIISSYKALMKLVETENYSFIHCHTPIASAIARTVAHKTKTKVIYTAHGFHFYDGAPKKNWMIYYPIEKFLSRWTDILITINKEDYNRAKNEFHAKKTVYVPGVGVDTEKFHSGLVDIDKKREELGVAKDDIMLLSVGELSKRKNHEAVIRALKELKNPKIKYFIVGKGDLKEYLEDLINNLELELCVTLLGFRGDVSDLCQAADMFVFPSHQEGLPVALMEAIACKTPVVCSNIRGNIDLVKNDACLFNENNVADIKSCLENILIKDGEYATRSSLFESMKNIVADNFSCLKTYNLINVQEKISALYFELGG